MRRARARVTTRALIIAVALVGLNLAGAVATSKFYPRTEVHEIGYGNGRRFVSYRADGSIELSLGNGETGYRLVRVVRCPPPPSLLGVWSPVVASAAFTLLALVVLTGRPAGRTLDDRSGHLGASFTPRSRAVAAVRRATVVVALLGLNVACFVYRPLPDRSDPTSHMLGLHLGDYQTISTMIEIEPGGHAARWGTLLRKKDGSLVRQRVPEGVDATTGFGEFGKDDLGTILYSDDGSIVGYLGRPGQTLARSVVLRPPTWSLLSMWSPVLVGGTTTLVVLVVASRRWWPDEDPDPGSGALRFGL